MDRTENINEHNGLSDDFYEFRYPYIYPTDDVLSLLQEVPSNSLTPLESVFVRWLVDSGSPSKALAGLINPAHKFDSVKFSAERLIGRPTVQNEIKRIRTSMPYARLYKSDYTIGVLHEEVQYLRQRNRKHRYEGGNNFSPIRYLGKKSINDHELSEIETLMKVLETLRQYVVIISPAGQLNDNVPQTGPDSIDGGIDGVIAKAKRLIEDATARHFDRNGHPIEADA